MRPRLIIFWQRYRLAFKAGASVGLATSLVVLLVIGAKNLQQSQANGEQIKVELTQLEKNSRKQASDIQKLNDHIDCIVNLYSQPDRQNLTIDDIRSCKLAPINSATTGPIKTNTPVPPHGHKDSTGSSTKNSNTNTPSKKDDGLINQLIERVKDLL